MVITVLDWKKPTLQACAVEFIGTFCLVFFGSFVYLQNQTKSQEFTWTSVAIGQGLLVTFIVWGGQTLSGGHFNWGVTIALAALRKMPNTVCVLYLVSQTLGSFLGAWLFLILSPGVSNTQGAPVLNHPTYTETVGFFCEFIATAFYMYMFMAFNYDVRMNKNLYGIAAGGAAVCAVISIGPITGAAINPARMIGPLLVRAITTNLNAVQNITWFYYLGPIFGALLIAFYYEYFMIVEEDQNPELSIASYEKESTYKNIKI